MPFLTTSTRDLLQKFKQKPIGHTAYWIDLCSDYEYVRHAWILEAMREIKTARKIGIDLINFHANLNGMFYGEKRKMLLDNMIKSLREIVRYAHKYKIQVMLENVPLSNGIHNIDEFTTMIMQVLEINIFCPIIKTYTNKPLFLLYVFYGSLVDAQNWILEIRRPC